MGVAGSRRAATAGRVVILLSAWLRSHWWPLAISPSCGQPTSIWQQWIQCTVRLLCGALLLVCFVCSARCQLPVGLSLNNIYPLRLVCNTTSPDTSDSTESTDIVSARSESSDAAAVASDSAERPPSIVAGNGSSEGSPFALPCNLYSSDCGPNHAATIWKRTVGRAQQKLASRQPARVIRTNSVANMVHGHLGCLSCRLILSHSVSRPLTVPAE